MVVGIGAHDGESSGGTPPGEALDIGRRRASGHVAHKAALRE
eukprot:gene55314-33839_t